MCFGVKILNFVYFGVNKSGISVFLVSAENGAGVNKMTNIMYATGLCMKFCGSPFNTFHFQIRSKSYARKQISVYNNTISDKYNFR